MILHRPMYVLDKRGAAVHCSLCYRVADPAGRINSFSIARQCSIFNASQTKWYRKLSRPQLPNTGLCTSLFITTVVTILQCFKNHLRYQPTVLQLSCSHILFQSLCQSSGLTNINVSYRVRYYLGSADFNINSALCIPNGSAPFRGFGYGILPSKEGGPRESPRKLLKSGL